MQCKYIDKCSANKLINTINQFIRDHTVILVINELIRNQASATMTIYSTRARFATGQHYQKLKRLLPPILASERFSPIIYTEEIFNATQKTFVSIK